jgi:hypothetical protein
VAGVVQAGGIRAAQRRVVEQAADLGQPQPVGTWLQQAALHVGPLRMSQPFLVIIDPIVSIALSVWLFDERFKPNAGLLAMAAVGFAVMCVGVVLLTQTAPATMKPDAAPPSTAEVEGVA